MGLWVQCGRCVSLTFWVSISSILGISSRLMGHNDAGCALHCVYQCKNWLIARTQDDAGNTTLWLYTPWRKGTQTALACWGTQCIYLDAIYLKAVIRRAVGGRMCDWSHLDFSELICRVQIIWIWYRSCIRIQPLCRIIFCTELHESVGWFDKYILQQPIWCLLFRWYTKVGWLCVFMVYTM